ncbi:MAG: FMN-binding glutamate synthase family protein [Alphaproteobacteria bacterium]|nr:FMN-binding glutamate synthase family protein [Alphaproteobacteria bacterium]
MMRKVFYLISVISLAAVAVGYQFWAPSIYFLIIIVPYIMIGIYDIFSKKHTILRNYPVIGHFRYLLESLRIEIRQYFIESELNGRPFSRETRSLVYQRAKGELETIPFGTQHNITEPGYEFSYHSLTPVEVPKEATRLMFGAVNCAKPYSASLLNISAMSFGALSPNAITALSKGAAHGNFAHNTGEGGLSPYHMKGGGDLIWQIGTGYFGCRHKDGSFNREKFQEKASLDQVKMIEIKLSQGAKPSHGGILPGVKVNKEIADIRGLEVGVDAISPPAHSTFSTPLGLLNYVAELRELSGGKPVGFKLCIGIRSQFMGICKAMLESGIIPDFITVDGAEGGTGAAPVAFTNRLGTPINEAISFVHNCLTGINKRADIRLIASGKVATGYDMVTKMALGADTCNSARAMMFALGCVQSLHCNTNKCPTGIATQDRSRWKSLDVEDKYKRVTNFHHSTIHSFTEILGAMGLDHPGKLIPAHIERYMDDGSRKSFAEFYPGLTDGELLGKNINSAFVSDWKLASADRF